MRDFFSFPSRFFDGLNFQRKSGIVFLICTCGLWLMFPQGEMWLMVCVLAAASGSCLVSTPEPSEPSEPEPETFDTL